MPLTLRPVPSRPSPFGSILLAMYLPSLRVLTLNTQSSFAPTTSIGLILASLYFSSTLRNFNFAITLSALRGLALRGLRVALA